jgi:hypothetical protein
MKDLAVNSQYNLAKKNYVRGLMCLNTFRVKIKRFVHASKNCA